MKLKTMSRWLGSATVGILMAMNTQVGAAEAGTAKAAQMRPSANVGGFVWQVVRARSRGARLSATLPYFPARSTGGRFIEVTFDIENRTGGPKTYMPVQLVDGAGRRFDAVSDFVWYVRQDRACLFETLNPGTTKRCALVFEVPKDSTNLSLRATDLTMEMPGLNDGEVSSQQMSLEPLDK